MMTLEQLAPQGRKARTGHFGAGQRGNKRRTASPACEYRKGQVQNGFSKGFGAAGVCPCCPTVGQAGQGQMDGQQYHVGCLFRLCIGADRPSYSEDSLQAAGRGGHKAAGYRTTDFCFHLMLGKASPKMLEVYRFLAENTQRIAQLKRTPVYSDDDCTSWWITDGLRIWDATPKEKEKIPSCGADRLPDPQPG